MSAAPITSIVSAIASWLPGHPGRRRPDVVARAPTRLAADSRVDVSILIVNWNTRDTVLQCLDAIPNGVDDDLRYEVIVVDNGSVDGSPAALASRTDITLIQNSSNLGFAAAVNQAYQRAGAEFVLLLNSDVDMTAGALSVAHAIPP